MKVDRAAIVDAALTLLNEVGIDGLSTRLLAERLNVRQPALYWHFKNKRALLDAMNDEILNRGHRHDEVFDAGDWKAFLIADARSFRMALLAYRDAARVHAGTEANPDTLDLIEAHMRVLVEAGMSAAFAMDILVAIGRYVVGCVLEEQAEFPDTPDRGKRLDEAASGHPLTAEALTHYRHGGHAAQFEAGLALIVEGAALRMRERFG
jgi:TetR/AcrR family transcriptional regulator, tetracycline repressor protein